MKSENLTAQSDALRICFCPLDIQALGYLSSNYLPVKRGNVNAMPGCAFRQCLTIRLTALRLLYSGGSAIRFAGKERRKPACRIVQRSQGYWFVLPTGNPFSVALVGQSPKWDGGVCRIRTGETCLEGRCVTTTLIRRMCRPKLTPMVNRSYKLLYSGKFNETKGVQRRRSWSLEWLG